MTKTIKCLVCSTEVRCFPSRVNKKFCSVKCHSVFRNKKRVWVKKTCKNCHKEFNADIKQLNLGYYKFCSNACKYEYQRGENSPTYKGGYLRDDGYKQVNHNAKQCLEHRVVMEKHLGRSLNKDEEVHHIDRDKLNNRILNLMLISRSLHAQFHTRGRRHTVESKRKMSIASLDRKRDEKGGFVK